MKKKLQFKYSTLMFLGNGTAQFLTLISTVIITKYYLPEVYGEYSLIVLFVYLTLPISTKRFELVSLSTDGNEISQLVRSNIKRTLYFSLIIGLTSYFAFFVYWKDSFKNSILIAALAFIAKYISDTISILTGLNLRNKKFNNYIFSGILQNSSTLILHVYLSSIFQNCAMLLIGFIAGRLLALIILVKEAEVRNIFANQNPNKEIGRLTTNTNFKQKTFVTASIFENLNMNLPFLFVFILSNRTDLGIYSFALNLVQAPALLLSNAIATPQFVFKNQHSLPKVQARVLNGNSISKGDLISFLFVGIAYYLLIIFFSSYVIPRFTGESWMQVTEIVRAISIPLAFQIFTNSLIISRISDGMWKLALTGSLASLMFSMFSGLLTLIIFREIQNVVVALLIGRNIGNLFSLFRLTKG